jgi:hypothetical protein
VTAGVGGRTVNAVAAEVYANVDCCPPPWRSVRCGSCTWLLDADDNARPSLVPCLERPCSDLGVDAVDSCT